MTADIDEPQSQNTPPVDAFSLARKAVAADILARQQEHQHAIAEHLSIKAAGAPQPLNLLCNGDSWFDYPLGGAVPFVSRTDVIAGIQAIASTPKGTPSILDEGPPGASLKPFVLNFAHYGDTAVKELGLERSQKMADALNDTSHGKFDAILLSAGGNDIAGDALIEWLNHHDDVDGVPAQALNIPAVQACLQLIQVQYRNMVKLRDRYAKDAPIFVHSYDFAVPNGVGVCSIGPWLKPGLEFKGWTNPVVQQQIVNNLLMSFDQVLSSMAQQIPNVVKVGTQGTLHNATLWANELHPTPEGFKMIADKFVFALRKQFPGRI